MHGVWCHTVARTEDLWGRGALHLDLGVGPDHQEVVPHSEPTPSSRLRTTPGASTGLPVGERPVDPGMPFSPH